MAGLFFCPASDTVQGFLFARMQHSPIQAFTACFAVQMQLYRPRRKTTHRALQGLFLQLHPLNRPRYQTDTSGYNTTCVMLEGIHAPGHAQPIPDTTATPERCTGQHRPSIIIRYIRGYSIPQTMPAAAGQRLHLCRVSPAGQSSSRGAAGGAEPLAATAAVLFGLSPDS